MTGQPTGSQCAATAATLRAAVASHEEAADAYEYALDPLLLPAGRGDPMQARRGYASAALQRTQADHRLRGAAMRHLQACPGGVATAEAATTSWLSIPSVLLGLAVGGALGWLLCRDE